MSDAVFDKFRPIETGRLRALASIGAAALVAFGLLCWIAANWSAFHRLTKLGLVGAVLAVAAVSAMFFSRARVPALLVATAATGGLLALIGQIYPSGADAWQLFAYWAFLALPFAFAARHDSVWTLWTLVATTAVGLWRFQERSGQAFTDWGPCWALAIALVVLLCPALPQQRILGRSAWAFRLAGFVTILMVAATGIDSDILWSTASKAPFVWALVVLFAGGVGLTLMRPAEVGLLALNLLAVDVLLIFRIAAALETRRLSAMGGSLTIAVIAVAIVATSVMILRRIAPRRDAGDRDDAHFDWPLAALSGFGAILAAVPFISFYAIAFEYVLKEASGSALLGAATLAVGVFILRGGAAFGFRQMFGMIATTVGLALIGHAAGRWWEKDAGFALCVVIAATALATPARWIRSVLGFAAATTLFVSIFLRSGFHHVSGGLAVVSLLVAAGALVRAAPAFGLRIPDVRAFASGWTAAGVCVLAIFAGRPFLAAGALADLGAPSDVLRISLTGPAQIVSIALGVAGVALLLWRRADLRTPVGIAIAVAALALTLRSPTLGGAIFVFACAFLAGARALAGFAALAAVWIVSAFYYALSWPLTQKAYVLVGVGAALGLVVLFTRERDQSAPSLAPGAPNAIAVGLAGLGLLLVGGVAAQATYQSETIIRDGRQIYMTLRPVDPRSLVQGDYMAIAFDTARLPSAEASHGEVMATASVDDRSIATLQSLLQPGATLAADQIALRLRVKKKRWFVGSDAWFFEEGRGKAFEKARYGVFRVGPNGRLILTALADETLRTLP